jgi:queuosine precursor transporter
VLVYLGAIVTANLLTAAFGPWVSVFNAFAFVGLDLTARDRLHDAWEGRRLVLRMGLLIAAGSAISWTVNAGAGRVAVASLAAFAASAVVDGLAYARLKGRPGLVRVNGSNVAGAMVDSLVFPLLAFGLPVLWGVVAGQFVAKVGGGLLVSMVPPRWPPGAIAVTMGCQRILKRIERITRMEWCHLVASPGLKLSPWCRYRRAAQLVLSPMVTGATLVRAGHGTKGGEEWDSIIAQFN